MNAPAPAAATASKPLPPCPITGRRARRRVHGINYNVLADIWRYGQKVDVRRLFKDAPKMELYESDTGLMFFDPMIVGDEQFYNEYYTRQNVHALLNYKGESRQDYKRAASFAKNGALVLDVGSGPGIFREHLKHAVYRGLDPYGTGYPDEVIIRETLEQHSREHPGEYDMVTAFHVIEHVDAPRRYAEQMARMLKPGGLMILAAPLHPSPLTEIPNFPINIPPHHVTWWNPSAFRALAEAVGLEVVEAINLPPSPHQGFIFWFHKLLPVKTTSSPTERYVAHRWPWHLSVLTGLVGAKLVHRFKELPSSARPVDTFLVARKPA